VLYRSIDDDLGKEYKDLGFISTTWDLSTIYEPMSKSGQHIKCCILEITIPSGSKILPVEFYSEHPDEREILLQRGSHMMVTNEIVKGGIKFLHMLYTPPVMIPTNNLQKIESVNEKLDSESKKLTNYLLENLDVFAEETEELDGDYDDFIDTVRSAAEEYQNRSKLEEMTVEFVMKSQTLLSALKKYNM